MKFNSVQPLGYEEGNGSIAYKLEATLLKASKPTILSGSKADSIDLYYIPCRADMEPDPQMYFMGMRTFRCHSLYLRPEKTGKSLTLREKIKSFFRKSSLSCSIFQIAINVPEVVYIGGPLPIVLSLAHDRQNLTAPELPTVLLTASTVTLIRTVHARAKFVKLDAPYTFSTRELLATKKDINIPLSELQNLSDFIALPSVQTNLGLSFATYNISQHCMLAVKVALKCVTKHSIAAGSLFSLR